MSLDLLAFADAEFEAENYTGALTLYEQALEADPQLAGAWLGKARVLAAFGALGEAEDCYFNAVEADPYLTRAWVELVQLERKAGAAEAARENLNAALRILPGHESLIELKDDAPIADDIEPMARALMKMRQALSEDDVFTAAQHLDRMEVAERDHPYCLVGHGEMTLHTGRGNISNLVQRLTQASRVLPDEWEIRSILGRLYLIKSPFQNPKMGMALCEDAWRISGENSRAAIGLIEAWDRLGKRQFADALLQRLSQENSLEGKWARTYLSDEDPG